jgi:hypothetical protein
MMSSGSADQTKGLKQHPLIPKDLPPGHGERHAEPLGDSAIGQPLLAQLIGALVDMGAVAGHGLMRDQEPHDQRRRR